LEVSDMLKVCLNGGVQRADHPAVPITPDELAADAARCRAAGAGAAHIHPRAPDGTESIAAADIAAAVSAVRAACPGLPVGVSTGAWIEPDPGLRAATVASWTVLPDFASVNWHEPGAVAVAEALLAHGVGVEAGVWTVEAATAFREWSGADKCTRVLVEMMEQDAERALATADAVLELVGDIGPPPLLHAEGPAVWPVLARAVERGLDTRIGLEDTLTLPDGSRAAGNVSLVEAAGRQGAR
jgi:uncharacterized protein (DUF849 family)